VILVYDVDKQTIVCVGRMSGTKTRGKYSGQKPIGMNPISNHVAGWGKEKQKLEGASIGREKQKTRRKKKYNATYASHSCVFPFVLPRTVSDRLVK